MRSPRSSRRAALSLRSTNKLRAPSPFLGLVSGLCFSAVCAYLIAHAAGALLYPEAAVRRASVTEGLSLSGIAVREELVLSAASAPASAAPRGARLARGEAAAYVDGAAVTAPASALFFDSTDGLEFISPSSLFPFDAAAFSAVYAARPAIKEGAYGRLVMGFSWYFAARAEDAGGAYDALAPGPYTLSFEGVAAPMTAELIAVSADHDGAPIMLFRLPMGDGAAMSLRRCAARLELFCAAGLALPAEAVGTDDAGNNYVYRRTAAGYERAAVRIIYSSGDSLLAAADGALAEGERILTDRRDIENEHFRIAFTGAA